MKRALVALLCVGSTADANECRLVELDFTPAELAAAATMRAPSQIVAWVEDASGNYVDTIFITQATGTYGLGNRPGQFDLDSGPRWPYGRRTTVFPIWAHRRAASGAPTWPELIFQDSRDHELSHAVQHSSRDAYYCRPMMREEPAWDAGTCASAKVETDKGVLDTTRISLYPPRNDIGTPHGYDHPSVAQLAMLNPFDAVSMPTPASGAPAMISAPLSYTLPAGDYVLWMEVSREFDHNATYSEAAYPSPPGLPWAIYGEPYRGQPSVLYQVPFTVGPAVATSSTADYAGYGDPNGLDGNVRPPDATITTGVGGSGAERLSLRADGGTPYRLRVTSRTETDMIAPAIATDLAVNTLTRTSAVIEFVAPGDDGLTGKVRGYEIRYVAGAELTDATFADAVDLKPDLTLVDGGALQEFSIDGLLFDTEYTVGIRALDNCGNTGALATLTFRTPERGNGEVDACFIATAAYGSILANDVERLRSLRDRVLMSSVLGELAVEAYYTFSPAVSGVISESELLRASMRAVLDPIVRWLR